MKNIDIVYSNNVKDKIYSIWTTDIFRDFQKEEKSYLNLLVSKLSEYPIFFYEMSDSLERNHLSALFKHIAYRKYENPYIQDLYYFHELVHIATLNYGITNFNLWKEKISENELIASLTSEVFIYFFKPELLGKTFDNLWADKFIDKKLTYYKNIHLPIDYDKDNDWIVNYNNNNIDFFSLEEKNWPSLINNITHERNELRKKKFSTQENEKWIIKYNSLREKWLNSWKDHYNQLERTMILFEEECKVNEYQAVENLQKELLKVSNENNVPFWQVPLATKL